MGNQVGNGLFGHDVGDGNVGDRITHLFWYCGGGGDGQWTCWG